MKSKLNLLIILCTFGLAAPAPADDDVQPRFVEVTGVGIVTQTPDIARVSFGVETQAPAVERATRENAGRMERLLKALKREGVNPDDIQTQHYNVSPRYPDRRRGEDQLEPIGYVVSNTITVTVRKLKDLGELIDKAVASGASRVLNVRFELSDPTRARKKALTLAVENARAEAETLLESTGGRLGPVLRVRTQGGHHAAKSERMVMSAARMDTPVEPGLLDTHAQVVVAFEILD